MKWMSVNRDGDPSKEGFYLTYDCDHLDVSSGFEVYYYDLKENKWHDWEFIERDITHWCELPEAPEYPKGY